MFLICPVCPATFQFTHPRRVRRQGQRFYEILKEFQFTHPRRVRPAELLGIFSKTLFQFTHPRRVRPITANKDAAHILVSIHAPA